MKQFLIITLFSLLFFKNSLAQDFTKKEASSSPQNSFNAESEVPDAVVEGNLLLDRRIVITMAFNGHFYIDIKVNDKPIRFMIDTGASDISLNVNDAKRVGIDIDKLIFSRRYQTAAGTVYGALTSVKKMEIRGLEFKNVPVSIIRNNTGQSLLGMSFLRKFRKYEFQKDKLILSH